MTDLLERLNLALPHVRTWINNALKEQMPKGRPVATLYLQRLPEYFSGEMLNGTKTLTVSRIVVPPVSTFGLPEFITLEQMPMAGITFTNLCMIHDSLTPEAAESALFHEMVHAIQWGTLGMDDYLLTYGAGLAQYGYAQSPLEALAFDLQTQFDRGMEMPAVEATVSAHALETRKATAEVFRRHGVPMGA